LSTTYPSNPQQVRILAFIRAEITVTSQHYKHIKALGGHVVS